MTVSVPTVQQVVGLAAPIVNVNPPPEGLMGIEISYTLTNAAPNQSSQLQLSSAAGVPLSQILSLCIDNTRNGVPVVVTHGAFNEVCTVPALTHVIVPTFTARGMPYSISVAPVQSPPSNNLIIDVIFLNYSRQSGSYPSTSANSGANSGNNSGVIYSNVGNYTSSGVYPVTNPGNFIITWIDSYIDGLKPTATGNCYVLVNIGYGTYNFPSDEAVAYAPSADFLAGPLIGAPITFSLSEGLFLPRGITIDLVVNSMSNVTNFNWRANIYGYSVA